ncbi:hypothetical protein U1Q18_050715 [Sarracenia purpurea var. burkii]
MSERERKTEALKSPPSLGPVLATSSVFHMRHVKLTKMGCGLQLPAYQPTNYTRMDADDVGRELNSYSQTIPRTDKERVCTMVLCYHDSAAGDQRESVLYTGRGIEAQLFPFD